LGSTVSQRDKQTQWYTKAKKWYGKEQASGNKSLGPGSQKARNLVLYRKKDWYFRETELTQRKGGKGMTSYIRNHKLGAIIGKI